MKKKKKNNKKSNSGPHFSKQSVGDNTKQCDSSPVHLPSLKLLTWRKTLSDDGFHQGCNCEDQSRPG